MKGIYITEEAKQEIESKIVELETNIKQFKSIMPTYDPVASNTQLFVFKEILQSATILPVYSNWDEVERFPPNNESQSLKTLELKNGVIIEPKQ
jgi:hypothetical protein